ncbi:hypothetical protein SS50377_28486 [Spironucleus salmonicida]|uniref:Uncharacterized protein n=1 Tax=Spironucleus salmonicida TaxID=348837 RepID=A0A9P8LK82_9EUKA|nr:hypothetical protein SS50377_28486 [Spironucleus salmonicida]
MVSCAVESCEIEQGAEEKYTWKQQNEAKVEKAVMKSGVEIRFFLNLYLIIQQQQNLFAVETFGYGGAASDSVLIGQFTGQKEISLGDLGSYGMQEFENIELALQFAVLANHVFNIQQ